MKHLRDVTDLEINNPTTERFDLKRGYRVTMWPIILKTCSFKQTDDYLPIQKIPNLQTTN